VYYRRTPVLPNAVRRTPFVESGVLERRFSLNIGWVSVGQTNVAWTRVGRETAWKRQVEASLEVPGAEACSPANVRVAERRLVECGFVERRLVECRLVGHGSLKPFVGTPAGTSVRQTVLCGRALGETWTELSGGSATEGLGAEACFTGERRVVEYRFVGHQVEGQRSLNAGWDGRCVDERCLDERRARHGFDELGGGAKMEDAGVGNMSQRRMPGVAKARLRRMLCGLASVKKRTRKVRWERSWRPWALSVFTGERRIVECGIVKRGVVECQVIERRFGRRLGEERRWPNFGVERQAGKVRLGRSGWEGRAIHLGMEMFGGCRLKEPVSPWRTSCWET
jgi:hypothetical protein